MNIIILQIGDRAEAFLDFHSLRQWLENIIDKSLLDKTVSELKLLNESYVDGLEIKVKQNYKVR